MRIHFWEICDQQTFLSGGGQAVRTDCLNLPSTCVESHNQEEEVQEETEEAAEEEEDDDWL